MNVIDLSEAKEEAQRENWSECFPRYNNEAEDEFPDDTEEKAGPSNPLQTSEIPTLATDWSYAYVKENNKEAGVNIKTIDHFIESEELDDDSEGYDEDESPYLEQGEAEHSIQTGMMERMAGMTLASQRSDFKEISDRKIQIDISFLGDKENIKRVMRIMESTIKKYSTIPGRVEVLKVSDHGIFTFNVTNHYLSPTSDSSDSPGPRKEIKKPTPRSSKQKPGSVLYQELQLGITLIPKFPGLPKKVLKYGDPGLSPDSLMTLKIENPSDSRNDILIKALKLSGNYRRVLNLYKLP